MKQYKFFTGRASTLDAIRTEFAKKGIAPKHVHTFERDNASHQFDGLILKNQNEMEERRSERFQMIVALSSLFSVLSIHYGWLSFNVLAAIALVAMLLSLYFGRYFSSCVKRSSLKKVYFLVVDADGKEEAVVNRVAKHYPDLYSQ